MRPVVPPVSSPSQKDIEGYKAALRADDGKAGKVDDWVSSGAGHGSPSRTSGKSRLSFGSPTKDNRPDDWLGSPSSAKKRSWKVKEIKDAPVPDLNAD